MAKKTVALSVEESIYDTYKAFCDKRGISLSKQVEIFIGQELKKAGEKNESK